MAIGRLYKRGHDGFWWFAIGIGGKKYRMSTKIRGGTPDNPPREVLLWKARKLAELGQSGPDSLKGEFLTVSDLLHMLMIRWEAESRTASLRCVRSRVKQLQEGLGGWRAAELKSDRILQYAAGRKRSGAAVATVNMELRVLARAYRIAVDYGRLPATAAPRIHRLPGENVRRRHVPDDVLDAIREKLPPYLSDVVWFLRLSGWRLEEGLGLEWERVDFQEQSIRLDTSKTGEPRVLNFSKYEALAELLRKRQAVRTTSPYVFTGPRGGKVSASTLRPLWNAAAASAGLPGAILHDLRRSMVRAMDRAGIPRSVAMTITGHKSERVYNQYGIVDEASQALHLPKLASAPPAREDGVVVPAARFRLAGEVRALRQLVAEALPHIANTEAAADVLARMRAAIGDDQPKEREAFSR